VKKFLVEEIISDGYERHVHLQDMSGKLNVWASFIECEEYLEEGVQSSIIVPGNCVSGEISIVLVTNYDKNMEGGTGFQQPIKKSPHINAYAVVVSLADENTILCKIDGLSNEMKVEYEKSFDFKVGDNIKIRAFSI